MRRIYIIPAIAIMLGACSTGDQSSGESSSAAGGQENASAETVEAEDDYSKEIRKFKDVQLEPTLNAELAASGMEVYDLKCAACHRLEGDRLVGPSWKGVTEKREPEWILNFITNVDEMLEKDPVAMSQLEECLVRMPNQNLSDEDALAVLEFMRKNDGLK